MSWLHRIVFRLRAVLGKRHRDQMLDEELQTHLALLVEQNIERGMSPEAARREAKLSLGGADQIKESVHDHRGLLSLETLAQDVRYAFRMLRKSRGFTAIAVLTLALGIGTNTAIFSVVDTVLLRPLAYKQPGRIVYFHETSQLQEDVSISMANFDDWRSMNTVFESTAPYRTENVVVTGAGEPERMRMRQITAGFFPTMGVRPILGRALSPDDDKVGAPPVALISEALWARKYARNPDVIGQKLTIDSQLYTIIGVMANDHFHGLWRQQSLFSSLWRLEDQLGGPENRGSHPGIYAYGRLKPGVTLAQARAQMSAIAAKLAKQYPQDDTGHGIFVDSLMNSYVGDVREPLLILMVAVGFVLLICCANVANLTLARGSERRREMAVRIVLGASRMRLIRQALTESAVLALMGGALGLFAAAASTGVLTKLASSNIPRMEDLAIDRSVLLFALAVSALTTLVFGAFPAWQASHTPARGPLKEGFYGMSAGTGRRRVGAILTVAEVAISLVVLVGAGLALKSLYRVLRADPGFDDTGVLTATFSLPDRNFANAAKSRQFVDELVARVQGIPGVEAAGFEWPLLGGAQEGYLVQGKPVPTPQNPTSADIAVVTPDAPRAMGVHLIRGRWFGRLDNEKAQPVCIVDTAFAEKEWPGRNAIGNHVAVSGTIEKPHWMNVVGVVSHVENYGVDQPSNVELYLPDAQLPRDSGSIIVRTQADPASLVGPLKAAMYSDDPDVPLYDVGLLSDLVDQDTGPRRLSAALLGIFAALALLLATLGLYGVISYTIAQRTHEIGIRFALGAQRQDVFGMVIANGTALLGTGLAIGLVAAWYLSRFMQSLLFDVKPTDVATFTAVPAILTLVALFACYIPARRAMRVDPMVALRHE